MRNDLDGGTHITVDLLEQPGLLQRLAPDRTKRCLGLGHINGKPKQKQTHEAGKGLAPPPGDAGTHRCPLRQRRACRHRESARVAQS